MSLMHGNFHPFLDKFILNFVDDILIYSKSLEEDNEHLRIVLQILRDHKLYANFIKCDFYKDQIQYLGHVITIEGITFNPKKFKTIIEWKVPKNMVDI